MNTSIVLGSVAAAIILLNICVTFFVARNAILTEQNRKAQYCLIWLLPVLGAVISAMFLRSIRDTPPCASRHTANEEDYPGVNMHPPVIDP
jgi:hypothetical protein